MTASTTRTILAGMMLTLSLAVLSCTPHDAPPELEISAHPEPAASPDTPARQLGRLLQITGKQSKKANLVRDVRHMLRALEHERNDAWGKASRSWYEALAMARGDFGKRSLEGWVAAYTKALGKKIDVTVLARLLLAETRGGRHSPYMLEENLTREEDLVPIIENVVPQFIVEHPEPPPPPSTDSQPPDHPGIPADDPLLTDTAERRCKAQDQNLLEAWREWRSTSFRDPVLSYWMALVVHCQGHTDLAARSFKQAARALAQSKGHLALAIEALGKAVRIERINGRRQDAADTYDLLISLWRREGLSHHQFGLDPQEFALRRIDEFLWASRYRALVGDYEGGKIHVEQALHLITSAYARAASLSVAYKRKLATFRAEAYHILAYRIAIEKREFERAVSLNMLALQSAHLEPEWVDRLKWFAGLYDYLAGHYEGARRRWEALLAESQNESLRPQIYFWLARTYNHLDQDEKSHFYHKTIIENDPLSYYSVVASPTAGVSKDLVWHELFGNPMQLEKRLAERKGFDLDRVRSHSRIAPLLLRAEILIAADVDEFEAMAVSELRRAMANHLPLERNISAYVYLSRLHHQAGQYSEAISLTTMLAKADSQFWQTWPEQLLIYFARPYEEIYNRHALETAVEKELLLAVSRQESGFTPSSRSGVGANGVMQLILPTARRFAGELHLNDEHLQESLTRPETNIALGSRYLKFLRQEYKGYDPAIFGSYNAGEAAMNIWLERRSHSNPLLFVELIPFSETKDYIKKVWRNLYVYRFLAGTAANYATSGTTPRLILEGT